MKPITPLPHNSPEKRPVVVIGAGPAGLAAAYRLVQLGQCPLVMEKTGRIGGLARTETHNGYAFDIGGHRFFTKMATIQSLWQDMLPADFVRVKRMSRIFFNGRFFPYPLQVLPTLKNLGLRESVAIVASYMKARRRPLPDERTFEQWTVNRFGRRLYETFFKVYTEKVWGMPCSRLQADWAAQRIKGMSLPAAAANALFKTQSSKTLIDAFFYPRRGPAMMWQRFAEKIRQSGAQIYLNAPVHQLEIRNRRIVRVGVNRDGRDEMIAVSHVINTAPLSVLAHMPQPRLPAAVRSAAERLRFRDFLMVVLILNRKDVFPDQWIYIHDPTVKAGRIQNFKNWRPEMVPDQNTTSLGVEYFCNAGDALWRQPDAQLIQQAAREVAALGLARRRHVIDGRVIRQAEAYPIYDPGFKTHLCLVRRAVAAVENLQSVGRNGMHRYNNMDHAMQSGIMAAENVMGARHDPWEINEEASYLET